MKMYDSVLQRVKMLERKNGIRYADTDGNLYKALKVILIIDFIYATVINALYLLGMLLTKSDTAQDAYTYILTPAICTLLIAAGFVLLLKKRHIIGALLTAISSTVLSVFFIPLMEGEYANTIRAEYYWRHLVPLAVLLIVSVFMAVIAVRAEQKLKKMYIRVTENIYNSYKVNIADGDDIDEEQWVEFLEKFDPYDYNGQFVKSAEELSEVQKS